MQPDDLADAVLDVIDGAVVPLKERLAALEQQIVALTKALPTPGPPGPPGEPGPPGPPGPPGDFRYRRTYTAGIDYTPGDMVTDKGSLWYAHEATRARPGESPAWQLMVQRGKRGGATVP